MALFPFLGALYLIVERPLSLGPAALGVRVRSRSPLLACRSPLLGEDVKHIL